jgi:hypothetical protein
MAWTVDASGTQTATINTEHSLDTPTTAGAYILSVDLKNLTYGDTVECRVYDMIDGANYALLWKGVARHFPDTMVFPPVAVTTQMKATLKQTTGTGRAFPWSVRRN